MKDKRINDPQFAYKVYVMEDFIERWNQKAEQYSATGSHRDLYAVFDEFITRFIIFNALYKLCAEKYGITGDKKSATEAIAQLLESDIETVTTSSNAWIQKLASLVTHYRLKSEATDKQLKRDLRSTDPGKRLMALLSCIYYTRCNLFHGEKEFADQQRKLLEPEIECLKILNQRIYERLRDAVV